VNIAEFIENCGPMFWPLLLLSILTLSVVIERAWFWSKILTHEREIAGRVLEAARRDWGAAAEIARKSVNQPIGRFLYAALELQNPQPDVFELALQASADEELAIMRRGDKILEAATTIAPLLGLLGTVLGLIRSLSNINIGDLGTEATKGVTFGISQSLYSTALGMFVAIISLAFYRLFQGFVSGQAKVFRQSGNDLELIYRQDWLRPSGDAAIESVETQPPFYS
jgi:biopolymer transport protein ExbB